MACVETKELSFAYPQSDVFALHDVTLSFPAGTFNVISGLCGSGKSTLLRALDPILTPNGTMSGTVSFESESPNIGYIPQDPQSAVVCDTVSAELAFSLGSKGVQRPLITRRSAEISAFLGIEDLYDKRTDELSGGQIQLLALASVLTASPELILADEPCSQLDPVSACKFYDALSRTVSDLGTTVIMTTHSLDLAALYADSITALKNGSVEYKGTAQELCSELHENADPLFYSMPEVLRINELTGLKKKMRPDVSSGRSMIKELCGTYDVNPPEIRPEPDQKSPFVSMSHVTFRFVRTQKDVLNDLSASFAAGTVTAVIGGNGSGKTTMIRNLCGALSPLYGKIKKNGTVSYLPQDVKACFTHDTVRAELESVCSDKQKIGETVKGLLSEKEMDSHPFDLSGGQIQCAALCRTLLAGADILLLDEPVRSMDAYTAHKAGDLLEKEAELGRCVILVTHDLYFASSFADRCIMLFDGRVISSGTPQQVIGGNDIYTTQTARICSGHIDNVLTVPDVLRALGTDPGFHITDNKTDMPLKPCDTDKNASEKVRISHAGISKQAWLACAFTFITGALTVFFGTRYFGSGKYYITALLVMLETVVPAFAAFEKRIPKAPEIVVTAVLCALAVAGRAAFYALPGIKPVAAVVIIAGAALGPETGFLTGALSMLVSNAFFGQGPWTPWQMFSMGLIGLIAGILCDTGILERKAFPLAVFGVLSVIVIYGGIMDPMYIFMTQEHITKAALFTVYAAGFPINCVHAVSTALFILILSKPLTSDISRASRRYGFDKI